MKNQLITVGVADLLLGLASRSEAQQSERLYPIFELTDEDVALIDIKDGSIDDWLEIVGEPTLTSLDFLTWTGWGPNDPASLDFRIWLAWHDATDRIFVAIERADNVYVNRFDRKDNRGNGSTFMQDSIQFMVDGDRSGGQFLFDQRDFASMEEWKLGQMQSAQHYGVLPEVYDEGSHLEMIHPLKVSNPRAWFISPPYADGGGGVFGANPVISVTEFYVTAFDRFVWNSFDENLVSELYPGKIIGFAIEVWDVDTRPGQWQSVHYLRGSVYNVRNGNFADTFAQGFLLGPGGEIPESGVSAVESITWARIKAMFGK